MVIFALLLSIGGRTEAQTVGFVAPGEEPSRSASRAALRAHQPFGQEQASGESAGEAEEEAEAEGPSFSVLESAEVQRALAGLGPRDAELDDPLDDVRRLVRRAEGERLRQSLGRLGERLGIDLLVTVRQVGDELELRGFNVERLAFYRGTLMISATDPPQAEALEDFVGPRAGALGDGDPEGESEDEQERPRRRNRWWIWTIIGGAVAAAVLIGYLVQPDEVVDGGVNLRIVGP